MRRVLHVLALVLSLSALALAQAKPASGSPEQVLMDVEHRWAATSLTGDVATLETILAPNFTGTSADGALETRCAGHRKSEDQQVHEIGSHRYEGHAAESNHGCRHRHLDWSWHRLKRRKGRHQRTLDRCLRESGWRVEMRRLTVDDDQEVVRPGQSTAVSIPHREARQERQGNSV